MRRTSKVARHKVWRVSVHQATAKYGLGVVSDAAYLLWCSLFTHAKLSSTYPYLVRRLRVLLTLMPASWSRACSVVCCMTNRSFYPLAIGMHYLTYDEAGRLPPRSAASTHAVVVALKDATACQMLSYEYYVPWIIP